MHPCTVVQRRVCNNIPKVLLLLYAWVASLPSVSSSTSIQGVVQTMVSEYHYFTAAAEPYYITETHCLSNIYLSYNSCDSTHTHMAGNIRGVLVFVIDLAVMKINAYRSWCEYIWGAWPKMEARPPVLCVTKQQLHMIQLMTSLTLYYSSILLLTLPFPLFSWL
jgi:hypothetical protein